MHLPIAQATRTHIIGQVPITGLPWLTTYYDEAEAPTSKIGRMLEYRSSVEVAFYQLAPEDRAELVRETAVRAITQRVYGPVESELRLVLEDLWREGAHNSAAAQRIAAMLPILRGEPVT